MLDNHSIALFDGDLREAEPLAVFEHTSAHEKHHPKSSRTPALKQDGLSLLGGGDVCDIDVYRHAWLGGIDRQQCHRAENVHQRGCEALGDW